MRTGGAAVPRFVHCTNIIVESLKATPKTDRALGWCEELGEMRSGRRAPGGGSSEAAGMCSCDRPELMAGLGTWHHRRGYTAARLQAHRQRHAACGSAADGLCTALLCSSHTWSLHRKKKSGQPRSSLLHASRSPSLRPSALPLAEGGCVAIVVDRRVSFVSRAAPLSRGDAYGY